MKTNYIKILLKKFPNIAVEEKISNILKKEFIKTSFYLRNILKIRVVAK